MLNLNCSFSVHEIPPVLNVRRALIASRRLFSGKFRLEPVSAALYRNINALRDKCVRDFRAVIHRCNNIGIVITSYASS